MSSPHQEKRPLSPLGRFISRLNYLQDGSYTVSIVKQLSIAYQRLIVRIGRRGRFCTNWKCEHDNPAQALAGQYLCSACNKGTYVILPSETIDASAYLRRTRLLSCIGRRAISLFFEDQRRQKAQDRVELERDLVHVVKVDLNKPLPHIMGVKVRKDIDIALPLMPPGLELRERNNGGTIPGTHIKVNVRPPTGDTYCPPPYRDAEIRFLALENLCKRESPYPLNKLHAAEFEKQGNLTRELIPPYLSQAGRSYF